MIFNCPHCGVEFYPIDPFLLPDTFECHRCTKKIHVEIDEGDEGPIFTLHRQPPGHELYPPKTNPTIGGPP